MYYDKKKEINNLARVAFIDGMELAWETARKLTHLSYGGYSDDEKLEIFGYRNSDDVLTMLSASEAISRIKEYEEEQAKISEEQMEKNIQRIFGTKSRLKRIVITVGKHLVVGEKMILTFLV